MVCVEDVQQTSSWLRVKLGYQPLSYELLFLNENNKTVGVNETTSVHITSIRKVNLLLLGKCRVYTSFSATETGLGEVFLPETISERGSFEL